jgi:hypothetical protein
VRGREGGGQIPIEGLGLELLGLSLNHLISDRRPRSNDQGWFGRGGAARSRGESLPETSRPATAGHKRLGDWPRRNQGGLANSAMAFTLA